MSNHDDLQNKGSSAFDSAMPSSENDKTKTLATDLDSAMFNLYEKREKIFTRKIEGFYQKVRLYTGWPLLLGYFLLPWLNIEGRQALLFDLPQRKFHILWATFWPQDLVFLGWGLIIAAFALFFVTTWLGRVWCGYTCPQTVWTAIFMWIEQSVEGERNKRIKLDQAPWSFEKVGKRVLKHGAWLGFAFLTALTFVGYFYGIRDLVIDVLQWQVVPAASFWLAFFVIATYVNAGWMREQVCLYMCPYARFQSAMFDEDTLIVSYDPARGEKRGARKRGVEPQLLGLGDCIDCQMCVQVCPTGIDIREGLQYECINCALCIDACDDIMDKMNYPKKLISYTTENRLAGNERHKFRPKLVGYGIMMLLMVSLFVIVLVIRMPLELDVIRDRGRLYQETADGHVLNVYTLKILNKSKQAHRYKIAVTGMSQSHLAGKSEVLVEAGELLNVPVGVKVDPETIDKTNYKIVFSAQAMDDATMKVESASSFLGPKPVF